MRLRNILVGLGVLVSTATSIEVDVDDKGLSATTTPAGRTHLTRSHLESVKAAAATAAWGLVRFYSGNETGDVPGNLPDPYYC